MLFYVIEIVVTFSIVTANIAIKVNSSWQDVGVFVYINKSATGRQY